MLFIAECLNPWLLEPAFTLGVINSIRRSKLCPLLNLSNYLWCAYRTVSFCGVYTSRLINNTFNMLVIILFDAIKYANNETDQQLVKIPNSRVYNEATCKVMAPLFCLLQRHLILSLII